MNAATDAGCDYKVVRMATSGFLVRLLCFIMSPPKGKLAKRCESDLRRGTDTHGNLILPQICVDKVVL